MFSKQNQGDAVAKSNPEMDAILSNIASLIEELRDDEEATNDGGQEGAPQQMSSAAMAKSKARKADEIDRQSTPQNASDPENPDDKNKGMAPWAGDKDEVAKALKTIMKAIEASQSEGPDANEDAEARIDDRAKADEEGINEVAKMLAALVKPKTVKKSYVQGGNDLAPALAQITAVVKSMADRQARTDTILAEMLEGLGASQSVQDPTTQVQKSAGPGNRLPVGQYNGNDLEQVIGAVVKAMGNNNNSPRASDSGIPVAAGFEDAFSNDGNNDSEIRKGLAEAAKLFMQTPDLQNRWAPAKTAQ